VGNDSGTRARSSTRIPAAMVIATTWTISTARSPTTWQPRIVHVARALGRRQTSPGRTQNPADSEPDPLARTLGLGQGLPGNRGGLALDVRDGLGCARDKTL
jgi:hypothetical protein